MSVTETSIIAYDEIKHKLSDARSAVYETLMRMHRNNHIWNTTNSNWDEGVTGRELNQHLISHSAHKRLSELSDCGLVKQAGTRKCGVTKRKAVIWKAQPASSYREPEKIERISKVELQALEIKALKDKISILTQEINYLRGMSNSPYLPGLES